jgi:hypothetical protein
MKKEPIKNERKLSLKHGVGCRTYRIKSKKPYKECLTVTRKTYYNNYEL